MKIILVKDIAIFTSLVLFSYIVNMVYNVVVIDLLEH